MDDTDDPIVHDEEQDEMLSFCSLFLFNVVLLDLDTLQYILTLHNPWTSTAVYLNTSSHA